MTKKTYILIDSSRKFWVNEELDDFTSTNLDEDGNFKKKTLGIQDSEGNRNIIFTKHIKAIYEGK